MVKTVAARRVIDQDSVQVQSKLPGIRGSSGVEGESRVNIALLRDGQFDHVRIPWHVLHGSLRTHFLRCASNLIAIATVGNVGSRGPRRRSQAFPLRRSAPLFRCNKWLRLRAWSQIGITREIRLTSAIVLRHEATRCSSVPPPFCK